MLEDVWGRDKWELGSWVLVLAFKSDQFNPVFLDWKPLCPPQDIWQFWRHSGCPIRKRGATGIQWVEAGDATKHRTVHRRTPQ